MPLGIARGAVVFVDGGFDREPCEVTFDIAREWWEKFHNPKIEFASPHFEEDTAAARLVSVVCDDWKKRQAKTAQELARPNLEDAVRASAALTSLLFAHVGSPNAATIVPMDRDTFNCGVMLLCQTTNDRLLAAYYGETKSHLAADRRAV